MTKRGILTFLGVVGICAAISGTFYFFYAQTAGTLGSNEEGNQQPTSVLG